MSLVEVEGHWLDPKDVSAVVRATVGTRIHLRGGTAVDIKSLRPAEVVEHFTAHTPGPGEYEPDIRRTGAAKRNTTTTIRMSKAERDALASLHGTPGRALRHLIDTYLEDQ